MTFRDWAAQPFADGRHAIDTGKLDPLHPLRHGHVRVLFDVRDGRITGCEIDVHANHRGDEKLLEVRDVRQGLALMNRHGWLTAPFAETLYARIVESMLGITPSPRAHVLRELSLALNRAAVDAYWEHIECSLDGTASDALQRREQLLGLIERLTGARMHTTYVRIGGVAADADADLLDRLQEDRDETIVSAAAAVRAATGVLAVSAPKSLRLPEGDAYDEILTPHGTLGLWLFAKGSAVPYRVHLRTSGFAALAACEQEAPGMTPVDFALRIARTRMVPGEVCR